MTYHYSEIFSNPEAFFLAFAALIFIISYSAIRKLNKKFETGPSVIISVVVSILGTYYLYANDGANYIWIFPYLFGLLVILLIARLFIWPIIKFTKRQFLF